jgi:hypothetical protein
MSRCMMRASRHFNAHECLNGHHDITPVKLILNIGLISGRGFDTSFVSRFHQHRVIRCLNTFSQLPPDDRWLCASLFLSSRAVCVTTRAILPGQSPPPSCYVSPYPVETNVYPGIYCSGAGHRNRSWRNVCSKCRNDITSIAVVRPRWVS